MISLKPQAETIDEVVGREEAARKARLDEELQKRIDLSKQLGDRAMNGDPVGINGFMAIGFPNLTPDMKEYRDLTDLVYGVKRIKAGKYIATGYRWGGVVGVKADTDDKGIAFRIQPEASGAYYAHAEVLCTRALYEHNSPSTGTMYGSETDPYTVSFIEGYLGHAMTSPVKELILATNSPEGYDQYAIDGGRASTDAWTRQIGESLSVI